MTDNQDGWAIGGGGNSFPFENVGDYVAGHVFEYEPNLPQTDPKTGEAKFWPSGQPRVMHRVGLHVTASSNPAVLEGMDASVYLKGGAKVNADGSGPTEAVILAAIKAATGHNRLQPGGKVTLQYVGSKGNGPGISDTKLYKAWYEAPSFPVGPTTTPPGQAPGAAPAAPPAAVAPPVTPTPGPVQAPATTAPPGAPGATAAPAPADSPAPAASTIPGLTPEQAAQLAALQAAQAAPVVPSWDADPRVGPMRAQGVADELIRQVLGI